MDREYLFVYGTLRTGSRTPQAGRLAREARHMGAGQVAGTLLRVARYPGLVDGEGRVTGDLYELPAPARTLRWLDRYEGEEFRRRVTPVDLAGTSGPAPGFR